MRDQAFDLSAPTRMGLGQIVRGHLKVASRGIHAAQHNLILQHQLPDEFGSGTLKRPVACRSPLIKLSRRAFICQHMRGPSTERAHSLDQMNQPACNIVTRYPQTPGPVIRVFLVTFWHDRVLGSDTLLASMISAVAAIPRQR
jgi:hypothetical protein